MLSETEEKALLELRKKFINSGDDITLAHLLDLVNSMISDQESQEWKYWTKHMEWLNEAWVQIVKEDQNIPWPEVQSSSCKVITTYKNLCYEIATSDRAPESC